MPPGPVPCRWKTLPRRRLPVASGGTGVSPRMNIPLSLSRHYRPFSALLNSLVGLVFSPRANCREAPSRTSSRPRAPDTMAVSAIGRAPGGTGGRPPGGLLAALLDVRADELLGVLLEHLVDLVEYRVHVVGELLVPLLDLLGGRGLVFLGLLGTPRRLPLATGVLRCHLPFLRPQGQVPLDRSNVILARDVAFHSSGFFRRGPRGPA